MKTKTIRTNVTVLDYNELSDQDRLLVDKAKAMTINSYAPYSNFNVGAAILLEDGNICLGANQENAAFPSGTCAERTAAFHASAVHPGKRMLKIAIAAASDGNFQPKPISPCGACRQALMEYEKLYGPIQVILYGRDEIYSVDSIADLLPLTFDSF